MLKLFELILFLAAIQSTSSSAPKDEAPPLFVLARSGLFVITNGGARQIAAADSIDTIAPIAHQGRILASRGKRLFLVDPSDGRQETILEHHQAVRFPESSPDGKHVAFSAEGESGWEIWLAAIDGSKPRKVVGAFAYGASFSADGKYLYFETSAGISRLDIETTKVAQILDRGHTVRCSRDGKHIAYSAAGELHLLDASRDPHATTAPAATAGRYDRFPSFSPDGKFIAFYRQENDRDQIIVRSLKTGDETPLDFTDAVLVCFLNNK